MTAPASGQLDTDPGSPVLEEGWLLCPEANEWSQPLALLMSDYSALACQVLARSSPSYEIQSGSGWGRSPVSSNHLLPPAPCVLSVVGHSCSSHLLLGEGAGEGPLTCLPESVD